MAHRSPPPPLEAPALASDRWPAFLSFAFFQPTKGPVLHSWDPKDQTMQFCAVFHTRNTNVSQKYNEHAWWQGCLDLDCLQWRNADWLMLQTARHIQTCALKVHCHAIQWFYVEFLRSKMAARRLEAAAPANEKQAFAALFFFTSFELRDQSASGYQTDTFAKSFLSRTKMALEIRSRKWKQKDKFAHEKWGKFMETKTGLHSSTDRSWSSCLGPKIVQDSRGFQVQLRIFRYIVQCTLR